MKLVRTIALVMVTTFLLLPTAAQERTSLPCQKDAGILKLEKLIEEKWSGYTCKIDSFAEFSMGFNLLQENEMGSGKKEYINVSIGICSDQLNASQRVKELGGYRGYEKVKYLEVDEAVSGYGNLIFRKGNLVASIQGAGRDVDTRIVALAQDILSAFEVAPKWFISHPVMEKFEKNLHAMLPKMSLTRESGFHTASYCEYKFKLDDVSGRISFELDMSQVVRHAMYSMLPKTRFIVEFLGEEIFLFEDYKGRLCKVICWRPDSHLDVSFDAPSNPRSRAEFAALGKAFIKAVKDELSETEAVKTEER